MSGGFYLNETEKMKKWDKPIPQGSSGSTETAGYVPTYHKQCHDCGKFLKKELWVSTDHAWKKHALCADCYSAYDDPRSM